jgi:CDP-diacylglycerol--glycerol-3-phosphate 3-phosphatidyltransferase
MADMNQIRRSFYRLTEPIVERLARTQLTPNGLTWIGFAINLSAAVVIATGHPFIAGFVVLAGGFCDMLDGSLARRTGRVSRFGAVLDSTTDRISEAALLLGVLIYFLLSPNPSPWDILMVGLALAASPLASYIRSRAETIGLDCKVGIFTRSERVVALMIGLWLHRFDYALFVVLGLIAILGFVTAGQRLHYVRKHTAN